MNLQTFNLHDFKSVPFYMGLLVGIGVVFGLILWQGRAFFKRIDLEDRGEWDRPLPHRFPKNMVVAMYKRQKQGHRHHRDYYQHRRPSRKEPSGRD